MGENLFDVNETFFIIDSNNLQNVNTKLYGYCIARGGIIVEDAAYLDGYAPSGEGAYIYVKREQDKIVIKQDFVGCYGLYMYRDKEYFALSNSFFMLEEYIRKSHKLTLNREYADYYLAISLASNSYSQTMVNEISEIDRSATIEIDINSKKIDIINYDYKENTVELDSQEGMEILDEWYNKWTGIIRNLRKNTDNLQTDLSGGFDSRMIFNLFLGANIDLNDMLINSSTNDLHTHKEDYEIATAISDYYGFKLNNRENIDERGACYTKDDIINISFYTNLGFHKQMNFKHKKLNKNRYRFTGAGGESVRDHWNITKEEYLEDMINRAKNYTTEECDLTESVANIVNSTFEEIEEKYRSFGRTVDSKGMVLKLYRETRCRNHFGREIVENYCGGFITLFPLLDPQLQKLKLNTEKCADKNFLMAVMFDRYNSKLLDFKFDSNKYIDGKTIKQAKKLNKKIPYTKTAFVTENSESETYCEKKAVVTTNNQLVKRDEINEYIKKLFTSGSVYKIFEMLYGEAVYIKMYQKVMASKYYPLEDALVIISISKILQDEIAYDNMHDVTLAEYAKNQFSYNVLTYDKKRNETLINHPYIDNYITARIDIKNCGSEKNEFEILKISDVGAVTKEPKWFQKGGKGCIIESKKGKLHIVLKCIKSGKLEINLRGHDARDKENERIPFWIDYQSMIINNEKIFDDVHPVWHDKPFRYAKPVDDNDIIMLDVNWTPHNPGIKN